MKSVFLFLFIVFGFSLSAQQNELKWLDLMLANYEYPFPANHLNLHVQHQDLKMAYMDVIPENHNGKNVLLLHGKNFNGAYWETTANALTEKGYRVVMPRSDWFWQIVEAGLFSLHFSATG